MYVAIDPSQIPLKVQAGVLVGQLKYAAQASSTSTW
jgi:hypothetical protein